MEGKIERKRYTKEDKAKALDMYLGGKTLTEVSKELTIPSSTLGTWFANCDKIDKDGKEDTKDVLVKQDIRPIKQEAPRTEVKAVELIEDKDKKIAYLEAEVEKLHEVIFMIKDEARREIQTLKDAIIIMAKNYN